MKCTVEGCPREARATGLCGAHYGRWSRHGNPLGGGISSDIRWDERLWMKTDKSGPLPDYAPHLGPCWIWRGALNNAGYPMTTGPDAKNHSAHRLAYELVRGPVPRGLTLDHLCMVRKCVNPHHLDPVTIRENILRSPNSIAGKNARKTHCIHGHELTPENTRLSKDGRHRSCKICKTLSNRARRKG